MDNEASIKIENFQLEDFNFADMLLFSFRETKKIYLVLG